MRVVGIIPARGGSKGIPNKNIKELNGKPLIAYTIEAALKSALLTDIVVTSDSDKILEVSKKYGVQTIIKRPVQLATDESPTIHTVIHALKLLEEKGASFDAVCLLQPTSPFRTSKFIDECIFKFKKGQTDSLVSVKKVPHEFNPHWVFEPNENGELIISTGEKEIISRRQELPEAFIRDGAIYLTRTEIVLKEHSLYGKTIAYKLNTNSKYVNIDTIEDWKNAENLI